MDQPHVNQPEASPRPPRNRLAIAAVALAVAALLGTGCVDDGRPPLLSHEAAVRTDLSCDQLTGAAKAQLGTELALAADSSGSGWGGSGDEEMFMEDRAATAGPAPATSIADAVGGAEAGAEATAGQVVAGTNVAEVGVDEGDIVKTDGRRIVSMVDNTLRVVALDGSPALDGELVLGDAASGSAEVFLRGDEALVLLSSWGGPLDGGVPDGDIGIVGPTDVMPRTAPGAESEAADTTVPDTTVPDTTVTAPTTVPDPTTTTSEPTTTTTTTTTEPAPTTTLAPPAPIPFGQGVTLVRVDVSDPANPTEVERRTVEGELVAARMVDGTARVVVRSQPPVVEDLYTAADVDEAQAVIDDLTADDLLPRVADDAGEAQPLGGCGDVALLPAIESRSAIESRPAVTPSADPSTVSVLSVGDTLADLAPSTVQGMADVVYASPSALYVTSTGWHADGPSTSVHRFDLTGDGPADYLGSGTAPGTLLDQYSMSERDGDLRLVTTVDDAQGSAGRLTVLRPGDDGGLTEVGHLDDLGRGERVQSVRFLGDTAYVVTFRQTDPLFAIDVSDPTRPTVLGELKVTGFSQYLHPVGDDLLLGLGREATEQGSDTGLKVSLFDVSDPAAPVEVDKVVIADGWSSAADDPHAFTWDPVAGHAIFPIEHQQLSPCPPEVECMVAPDELAPTPGAIVIGVEGRDLTEVVELRHDATDPWTAQILRSVVVDRDLWTLSQAGLGRSDADAPSSVDLIRF